MAKPYRIKREVYDDEGLRHWDAEDLQYFNLLNEHGQNIAEESPASWEYGIDVSEFLGEPWGASG